jgi:hypothetical protein
LLFSAWTVLFPPIFLVIAASFFMSQPRHSPRAAAASSLRSGSSS